MFHVMIRRNLPVQNIDGVKGCAEKSGGRSRLFVDMRGVLINCKTLWLRFVTVAVMTCRCEEGRGGRVFVFFCVCR